MDEAIKAKIQKQIEAQPVLLYMKGSPDKPMCGFSAGVINMLRKYKSSFATFDVLSDIEIRNGIKEFTDWPTIPQLYVNKKFIGGHDILLELDKTGELKKILQSMDSIS